MDDDFDFVWWAQRVFIGGLVIGVILLGWVYILVPLFNQADYNNFNNSPQHINAVAQKFSDDCQQLGATTDPTSRKAIKNDIYTVAATVDLDKVQMPDTTRTCVKNAVNDVASGH